MPVVGVLYTSAAALWSAGRGVPDCERTKLVPWASFATEGDMCIESEDRVRRCSLLCSASRVCFSSPVDKFLFVSLPDRAPMGRDIVS